MNAVIETLASIETIPEQGFARADLPSGNRSLNESTLPARLPLRQARQRWSSSMCDRDLQCLLQILEVELIPQLLNSYSPAAHAPDDRLASG